MAVLLIGSGGREHSLAWSLAKGARAGHTSGRIYCAPGNGGTAEIAENVSLDISDHEKVIDFCREHEISLVVIGPEQPLVEGLADSLENSHINVFGPSRQAARLEGSKAFAKDFCLRHNIPTARYRILDKPGCAREYIRDCSYPLVIKADGLAAGKGVVIARHLDEAEKAIDDCFSGRFGGAGKKVVVEKFLQGEEASFFALCDGETALELPTAQDHKRAFDGDEGPNTGGMGAYSPAPVMTAEMRRRVMDEIVTPTLRGMKEEGAPFRGVLYCGLMITADGPQLIEYNVRFGDPECQVLMARLKSDLYELLLAASRGGREGVKAEFDPRPALTVVMAAKGYPGSYQKGDEIRGVEAAEELEDVIVFHAGTRRDGDRLLASGGRVLNITALGDDIAKAQGRAYEAIARIDWPGGFCRHDIGWRAVERLKRA